MNLKNKLLNGITHFFRPFKQAFTKTIFTKYLLVTSAVIIASCLVLGFILITFAGNKWKTEKQDLLASNAENIASLAGTTANRVDTLEGDIIVSKYYISDTCRDVLKVSGNSIDSDIFIVDRDGNTVLCSENLAYGDTSCKHSNHKFSSAFISTAMNRKNGFRTTSTLDGIYDEDYFIVGVPIYIVDTSGQNIQIGLVLAATTAEIVSTFRDELTRVFAITIIIFSLFGLLIVYFLTYRMVRPLRQMAAATHAFANGDFSVRVPVQSKDEIGQLSSAINSMAASLSSSETVHRSFVANVSHELKTPMTSISGFVHGMLDGTIPQERHPEYLARVADEADRLSRLVKAMLDLSKIDSGAMKLNKMNFNLTDAVFQTIISFEQRISDKNLDIRGTDEMEPFFLEGDPDLIHQVIYNLFENAVKFVNTDGYIELEIYEKDNFAHFRIRNSGAGVPHEELMHIFDRFYKTDRSRSVDKTGVGLGLYIVRTVLGLHEGDIAVRSELGEYTEFEFRVPMGDK